jgi:hypothetical protein
MRQAVLILSGLAVPGWAAAQGFEAQTLRVPGTVQWVDHGDLDGDGWEDLVVSYRRGAGASAERFVAAFYRSAEGFGPRPSHAVRALPSAAVFDVGPSPDAGRDEILMWARDGVYALGFAGRRVSGPHVRIRGESLVGRPEDQDLPRWDFARTVDGRPTLVLLGPRGLRIHRLEGETWTFRALVPVRPIELYDAETDTFRPGEDGGAPVRNYAFRVTRMVPKLTFIDQTGDGRSDVVATFEDRVEVFAATADGFGSQPVFRRGFGLRTRAEVENRDATLYSTVAHLDGDGVADLCLSKSSGGLTSFKSEVRLYRGVRGGGFETKPAQVFEAGGVGSLVSFVDVDGDGALEMLEPRAEISLTAMVRALFARSFQIEVDIRRRATRGPAFFEPEVVQDLAARFDLDLGSSTSLRGSPPLFGHDFDGDGQNDVILPLGAERMVLHKGVDRTDRFVRPDGFVHLDGEASGTTLVLPTGRPDAPPDVLVYYVGRDDLRTRLLVHVNQHALEGQRTP